MFVLIFLEGQAKSATSRTFWVRHNEPGSLKTRDTYHCYSAHVEGILQQGQTMSIVGKSKFYGFLTPSMHFGGQNSYP